jgi:hypothetical protein
MFHHKFRSSLTALALLACLAILSTLVGPAADASVSSGPLCTTYRQTPTEIATGATCTEATENLRQALYPYVNADCGQYPFIGHCGTSLHLDTACHLNQYLEVQVSGWMIYRCKAFLDGPGPD